MIKYVRGLLLLLCCCSSGSTEEHMRLEKINGLSFVGTQTLLNKQHIKPIIAVNASWIALSPFGFVPELNSPKVHYSVDGQWWGETFEGLRKINSLAREQGLKVMLKPQLWVKKGAFTGFIRMENEEDYLQFEKEYQAFIIGFAKLAEALDVPLFCIGTELQNFVADRPEFWSSLIVAVKKVYQGKITYAANWDAFDKIPFWNAIDYIGVDAYFPLLDDKTPEVEALEQAWISHKEKLLAVSILNSKPILFTEFGYRSVAYTAKEPWSVSDTKQEVDVVGQQHALTAIFNVFWEEDWFAGGFLWKWFPEHTQMGGLQDKGYTPQNKPAEIMIQEFYKNQLLK